MLEIQGTLNSSLQAEQGQNLPIGKLDFPLYNPSDPASNTAWQKRVHLYIGKHQRLTGEVKKLSQPVALLRKAHAQDVDDQALEVAEIIHYKVIFTHRPEPVEPPQPNSSTQSSEQLKTLALAFGISEES